jgi:hypothetical protein
MSARMLAVNPFLGSLPLTTPPFMRPARRSPFGGLGGTLESVSLESVDAKLWSCSCKTFPSSRVCSCKFLGFRPVAVFFQLRCAARTRCSEVTPD